MGVLGCSKSSALTGKPLSPSIAIAVCTAISFSLSEIADEEIVAVGFGVGVVLGRYSGGLQPSVIENPKIEIPPNTVATKYFIDGFSGSGDLIITV